MAIKNSQQTTLAQSVRLPLYYLFLWYDRCYQKLHRPQAVDDFLRIKPSHYRGPERSFDDGTHLRDGDPIAVLHFNNDFLAPYYTRSASLSPRRVAFVFKSQIIQSLQALARKVQHSQELNTISAFTGITWFKHHGGSLGFSAQPVPPGLRKQLLILHFRWLLAARFPRLAQRENHRIQPHQFWLTRNQLLAATADIKPYGNK